MSLKGAAKDIGYFDVDSSGRRGQGVGHRHRHAQPCRRRRQHVQGAGREGHQHPGDLHLRDQDQRPDRCAPTPSWRCERCTRSTASTPIRAVTSCPAARADASRGWRSLIFRLAVAGSCRLVVGGETPPLLTSARMGARPRSDAVISRGRIDVVAPQSTRRGMGIAGLKCRKHRSRMSTCRQPSPGCGSFCVACARSWRNRATARAGSTRSSARSPASWWPRSARSISSGRTAALELFATEGLNPAAVHRTFMKRGEGLVGRCAEMAVPVNEPDAQSHPAFSYRPETGEEIYHSFLAVPILRSGDVLGVLTVQNKTPARLLRRGRRDPADDRDGARRASRLGGVRRRQHGARVQPPGRPRRQGPGACPKASRSATRCCTSRASSSPS